MINLFNFFLPNFNRASVWLFFLSAGIIFLFLGFFLTRLKVRSSSSGRQMLLETLRFLVVWLSSLCFSVFLILPFVFFLKLINLQVVFAYFTVLISFNLSTTILTLVGLRFLDSRAV